ncbi:23S rRNA (pseudouridine(1915)-N(3))-methyltransferase RlmH [bacterium]|nr:23S rRNA (pseudouridine(1915)-N(3))-methyltransferase RlmH [bacterium]
MKIKIIALGKVNEAYLKIGIDEFLKRIAPYVTIEVSELKPVEIKDENLIQRALDLEADKILDLIKPSSFVITMEIGGKMLSSEDFAAELNEIVNSGVNELVFVIGSSHGLSSKVSERADYKLSLSRMTFLHNFARLILIEQIYRAFKIIKGEVYHK